MVAEDVKKEYEVMREQHQNRSQAKQLVTIQEARKNAFSTDWSEVSISAPKKLGVQVLKDYPIREIRQYIDWTPFFQTWMLKGKFPAILEDPSVGKEALTLYRDANDMLDQIERQKWLKAHATFGLFKANSKGDDVIMDAGKEVPFHFLRQQGKKASSVNRCLSDFVAPVDSGIQDYMGLFAVTAGAGIDEIISKFREKHDEYGEIMIKALADRLAEAFAELLHEKVRKDYWGYAAKESFSNDELISEKYRGIRPAPGYPACPDHLEKDTLFKVLNVEENTGISLTESRAMNPAASISGYYFGHPEARYFNVGKISRDQAEDYAKRKKMDVVEVEKWLESNLAYLRD